MARFKIMNYQKSNMIIEKINNIEKIIAKIQDMTMANDFENIKHSNRVRMVCATWAIDSKFNKWTIEEVEEVLDNQSINNGGHEVNVIRNTYYLYKRLEKFHKYSYNELLDLYMEIHDNRCVYRVEEYNENYGDYCYGYDYKLNSYLSTKRLFERSTINSFWNSIEEVISYYTFNKSIHPLIRAIVTNYYVEEIQPYKEDNEQMARLWMIQLLSDWSRVFTYVPIDEIINNYREIYYKKILEAEKSRDLTSFIEFILELICDTLDEVYNDIIIINLKCRENNREERMAINDKHRDDCLEEKIDLFENNIICNGNDEIQKIETNKDIELECIRAEIDKNVDSDAWNNNVCTLDETFELDMDLLNDYMDEYKKLESCSKRVIGLVFNGVEVTKNNLLEEVNMERKMLTNEYIKPLLNTKWIEMTNPQKPTSPKQKYRMGDKIRTIIGMIENVIGA